MITQDDMIKALSACAKVLRTDLRDAKIPVVRGQSPRKTIAEIRPDLIEKAEALAEADMIIGIAKGNIPDFRNRTSKEDAQP